ncbi:hypothetical protein TD95_004467 [Thielaviopsis punctulata]|uniref:protein-tyrosine-phosphatase n=1 Tax=Thielaviopsis punctulata TaxID=72032 RepID=A0A0F4ZKY3_9PEZI|nr:hypothetical protein TD95_004467 [Thielaviopsis punctulata]
MPSAATRRLYEDQIPSFMSVFDLEPQAVADRDTITILDPRFTSSPKQPSTLTTFLQPPLRSSCPYKHRDSASSVTSESANSSPTTALSTSDLSSMSDHSPSSPDSPVAMSQLQSLAPPSFTLPSAMSLLSVTEAPTSARALEQRPMTSPAPRRARNMKNLSIMPPLVTSPTTQGPCDPTSPSFIKPMIPAMKRKPSNLSLNTNTKDLNVKLPTINMPMSPGMGPILQRRALKHSISTPHMLTGLKSATFAPAGGMTFPTVFERNESGLSEVLRPSRLGSVSESEDVTVEVDSPIKTQVAGREALDAVHHLRDESENNEDQKSPTYPAGPVAIYDNDVYLYLEPNAEEASRFDVVINVAREVKNPFETVVTEKSPVNTSPCPGTATTDASFTTAFEFPQSRSESPSTPKALNAKSSVNMPEYIHMPWDHNTDISVDLMELCEKIDRSVKEGKKVLVHCQQGASRSASLIIAYGLFRNPELSVNDAYYAAQSKSRWISPNMKLMYCLQDFQKEVTKRFKAPPSALRQRSGRSPTKHRLTLSADIANTVVPREPLTAPLPRESHSMSPGLSTDGISPMRVRIDSGIPSLPITPGPSSAPSSFSWSDISDDSKELSSFPRFELAVDSISSVTSNYNVASECSHDGKDHARLAPQTSQSSASHRSINFSRPITWSKPPPSPGFSPMSMSLFGNLNAIRNSDNPRQSIASDTFGDGLSGDPDMMSPRVEVMTSNPLRDTFAPVPPKTAFSFIESPPTPKDGLFSPRESSFPHKIFSHYRPSQVADPRSPPTKGETPIVRSIDEIL